MTFFRWISVVGVLLFLGASFAWGQSNTTLDTILASKQTTFGEAAYLALSATKRVPDATTIGIAAVKLEAEGWGIAFTSADEPLTLGEYSYIIMKAFRMQGGIMYHFFPGPRYAARELSYLRLIPGSTSPYRSISGREAVDILGNVLGYEERP